MAEYKSRYGGLGFYVNGKLKTFAGGRYVTDDKEEIEVLDNLADAWRVDAPKGTPPKEAKAEAVTEEAPKKPAPKRKPSAK